VVAFFQHWLWCVLCTVCVFEIEKAILNQKIFACLLYLLKGKLG
jgi:hypothetical protein